MKYVLALFTALILFSCTKDEELTQRDAPAPTETIHIQGVGYGHALIQGSTTRFGAYKIEQNGLTVLDTQTMQQGGHAPDINIPAIQTRFICGWQSIEGVTFWLDTFTVDLAVIPSDFVIEKENSSLAIISAR